MFKNLSIEKKKILNLFVWCLPFSIIFGNLFINLNVFLILVSGVYNFKKNFINFIKKYYVYTSLFLIFLLANLLISIDTFLSLKGVLGLSKNTILSLIIFFWLCEDKKNLKTLLLSIFLAQILLIISLFINLGYLSLKEIHFDRINGLFKDESVAGSYIIKLIISSILFFIIYLKNVKYLILFIALSFVSILITGDRAPAFLFFVGLIFFVLFNKKIKFIDNLKIIISFTVIVLIFFFTSMNFRNKITYTSGQLGLNFIEKKIYNLQKNFFNEREKSYSEWVALENRHVDYNFTDTQWFQHYSKAFEIGKQNIITGSGIKTFREACKIPKYNTKSIKNFPDDHGCATHPHNIYFEIFSETGLIGLVIFVFFIFNPIFSIRKNSESLIKTLLYCSIIILFFPLQTTGSFFSTFNGLFYFLITSINIFIAKYYKFSK